MKPRTPDSGIERLLTGYNFQHVNRSLPICLRTSGRCYIKFRVSGIYYNVTGLLIDFHLYIEKQKSSSSVFEFHDALYHEMIYMDMLIILQFFRTTKKASWIISPQCWMRRLELIKMARQCCRTTGTGKLVVNVILLYKKYFITML